MISVGKFKGRIWFDPETNQINTYQKIEVGAAKLPFWRRLIYAFWYAVRPRDEDVAAMAFVRIEECPPPIDSKVQLGVRVLAPDTYRENA